MTNKIIRPSKEKLIQYGYLMRLDKPIGVLLLLWPTLWALWLAGEGMPDVRLALIFIAGTIIMRAAGCVMNDLADRHFDGAVQRTQFRPLATGKVGVYEAIAILFILLTAALGLALLLNRLAVLLAMGGVLLAAIYPWMKRFTHLPQWGLGLAFSWGVPMAFAAVGHTVPWQSWFLFITAAIWPVIYDTLYAEVDRLDDVKLGIKSTAILWEGRLHPIMALLQIIFLLLLTIMGHLFALHKIYYLGLCVAGALFIYQHFLMARNYYFKAFLHNQWVGLIIFMGILLNYL